ncbi:MULTISPECIES: HlyD family efflux transporter periplasmic adaptor subunit [Acinetobacter]|jgi:HlyD family secretion protein|uniref:HlyD family efflux transporter periplasmic adaptor subunit n=1 Tax=Acinetobacter TaxID=469 RepID=UPI000449D54D|nr:MULTISPECIES: HlyD family efflux transporter periplasmic adaptor subunit [Acinetobacter]MDQ9823654.1 HlyD family efflux transporter periplasmic adaptor subunit [Acinetobacter sp. 163]EHU1209610.1 HlyD family efflux transporter periplasmic adaptor subunit [Acinetobacter nosocomialis]EXH15740.1 efflux transporter, RND family, MFP subunit [Acinetobacter sp. 1245593]EXR29378.1 efflux transporter, RND family, MFP subunit [Acinetobacter sp. 1281984]MBM9558037.1 HlyD family efflux transporter peri
MNKKVIAIVLVIIALVVIGFWVWGYKTKNQEDSNLTLYGNVDIRQVSLAFEQSGRIEKLLVQEGDKVKAGQVLATLNTNALQIQAKQAQAQLKAQQEAIVKQQVGARPEEISQAKAQLASAQADLDKASKNLQRLQILVSSTDGRAISQQELDYAKSNQHSAEAAVRERQANLELVIKGARQEDREATKAQYDATKANLDLINYNLTQAVLKSPVSAVVRARLQEVGDMTTAQKAVYTLALTDPKWVRVYANEKDLSSIHMGGTAQVIRDADPNQSINGKIGYISSVSEFTPKTVQTDEIRTTLVYEVRVYVNDPNDQLKMGQPVTVKVPLVSGEEAHD